jgi:hypothetical protein
MAFLYPQLVPQNGSRLTFPWAEYCPKIESLSEAHFGPDGVGLGMTMVIHWPDLGTAIQQILGYSYRDVSSGTSVLRRVIPFQHPAFPQLFAKAITRVVGMRLTGKAIQQFSGQLVGVGAGAAESTYGATWYLALLTISFWRPPYYVRTDDDIKINVNGKMVQQEYLRYFSKAWKVESQILSREAAQGLWRDPTLGGLPGSKGQVVSHMHISRTWYQIPEQALFDTAQDGTPTGLPSNLLLTQTPTFNPITYGIGSAGGFTLQPGSPMGGCVNIMQGGVMSLQCNSATMTAGSPVISNLSSTADLAVGFVVTGQGVQRDSVVTNINSDTEVTISYNCLFNYTGNGIVTFEDPTKMFMGCPTGTLQLLGIEINSQPLHLPPALMGIPALAGNEPISQQQYDVVFHFSYFDPPNNLTEPYRGHNLVPYSGTGRWGSMYFQLDAQGVPVNDGGVSATTPCDYADFTDLFTIL